ncbi:hypothetical protein Tco_0432439 [Tanacetum coccineum]
MLRKEIHLDVVGTSRCHFKVGRSSWWKELSKETVNFDAVSTVCKSNLECLRVKLQSCPVSSQIESKSKDLSSLSLDELISNLKVHKMIMEKDSEIVRGKREKVKSLSLKAKKESSDDESSISRSEEKYYAMAVRDFKKFFRRRGRFVRQPRDEK